MRKFLLVTAVCLASLFVHRAMSAEANEQSKEQTEEQTEEQAEPTPESPEPTPEVFMPTEEISEDFAVPFPVDI